MSDNIILYKNKDDYPYNYCPLCGCDGLYHLSCKYDEDFSNEIFFAPSVSDADFQQMAKEIAKQFEINTEDLVGTLDFIAGEIKMLREKSAQLETYHLDFEQKKGNRDWLPYFLATRYGTAC